MPTHFRHDCPHCLTRGAGFEAGFQWGSLKGPRYAHVLAVCGVCKGGMVVLSEADPTLGSHTSLVSNDMQYPSNRHRIVDTWPKHVGQCPENVPPNIEKFYVQGLENLASGRWDAASAMFRKSLDVATKTLAPEHRAETLFKRINQMVEAGQLTPAMGDWSHEIRLDGNDAVHDDEPETEHDARGTQKFGEAFLTYAYTLPEMVKGNRAKRTSLEAGKEAPAD